MIAGSSLSFLIHLNNLCLSAILLIFWFQNWLWKDLGSKNSACCYRQRRQLLLTFLTMIMHWWHSTQFVALIGQNVTGEFMWKMYSASWNLFTLIAEADSFGSANDVLKNETQLLSRVFCYLWLVCLLGFWLTNVPLVKVGNLILALLDGSQELHLEWQAWVIIAFDVCFF